jgi:hypothetical protein
MKIFTHQMAIDVDDPFKNDVLKREFFAHRLKNIIINTNDSLVISINADWGEGKTTFLKMFLSFIDKNQKNSIYFDAFSNDFNDNPFVSIIAQINSLIENKDKFDVKKNKLHDLNKNACKIGSKMMPLVSKMALKIIFLNLINKEDLNDFQAVISDSGGDIAERIAENAILEYNKNLEEITHFKKELEFLAHDIRISNGCPLVFVVDELDRCRPNYALSMIEVIKHFFTVKNVVFILAINKRQIESSIKAIYGSDIDSKTYLQKFINLECSLPKKINGVKNDYYIYCTYLYELHEFEKNDKLLQIITYMPGLSNYFNLSLRDIEKCFCYIALFYISTNIDDIYFVDLVCLLSVLKLKKPELFDLFKNKKVWSDDFNKHIGTEATNGPVYLFGEKDITLEFFDIFNILVNYSNPETREKRQTSDMFQYKKNYLPQDSDFSDIIPSICCVMENFEFNY